MAAIITTAAAAARFPQPQFETGHVVPVAGHPAVFELLPDWADATILTAVLLLTAWAVLRRRSRRLTLALSLACLAWYGFVRHGCICPVGATQDCAEALFGGGGMPWIVGFLFAAPLVAALFFGRVFCAAACPLGAIQDIAVVKPLRVPKVVDAVLRLLPLGVLALAVVMAANDAVYPICVTDPFVGLFRRSAPAEMLLAGAAVLLLGTVIARPYCRYACPYGVLLGWCSRLAWRRATITPDICIRCRLCERICPFDAIQPPRAAAADGGSPTARRPLLLLLLLTPVLVALGGWAGHVVAPLLAVHQPEVRIEQHLAQQAVQPELAWEDVAAFREQGGDTALLHAQATAVRARFAFGASLAGALLGLALGWRLVALARRPVRPFFSIDHGRCVSCGRCFGVCPQHRVWLSKRRGCDAREG